MALAPFDLAGPAGGVDRYRRHPPLGPRRAGDREIQRPARTEGHCTRRCVPLLFDAQDLVAAQDATQPGIDPPTFVFFVNDTRLVHFSYERYLENQIRRQYGYLGTPLKLVFRARGKE